MNDKQRTVLGVATVALIIAIIFFVPWRVESMHAVKWAPIYRAPITYYPSFENNRIVDRYIYENGHIAAGLYVLEILVIIVVGGVAYTISARSTNE